MTNDSIIYQAIDLIYPAVRQSPILVTLRIEHQMCMADVKSINLIIRKTYLDSQEMIDAGMIWKLVSTTSAKATEDSI